ncbi:MAG: NUDIX hydrolase [Pseudomonadales bacterium]
MHRNHLLTLLDRYKRRFPSESLMASRMRYFVAHQRCCFDRELSLGHVTGSAWLLDARRQRVLLTHHAKLDKWMQLGGHADGESDVASVAHREAAEESGIADLRLLSPELFDIDIHLIPARRNEPSHYHYDCRFVLQCIDNEDYVVSDESHDLRWIPIDDVHTYTREPSVMRMVAKTRTVG